MGDLHQMKTKTILLGSAAIALTAVAAAAPAEAAHFHGWYVALEGGADWVQDWNFKSATTTPTSHTHFDKTNFNTGWAVLASIGYAFSDWRVELEGGYRDNKIDSIFTRDIITNTFDFGGSLREYSIMANVHYDIPITSNLMFSIGAGAGGDHVDVNFKAFPGSNISDWRFAYQGIAGLSYALGSRTDLFLNYRYMHVDAPDMNIGPVNGHVFDSTDDLQKHTVTIGLRYDLWADEEPVEVVAPPPPPPPSPSEPARSFMIFFGFNKCNITAEADRVLSEAADSAKATGSAHVTIVGHTDTSGSPRYNQKLSECRAHAAASNLEGKGIPRSAISATGKGETELMVQTGDGVKEPQNRRATVDLN
jgi:outer membrane protein OmpA-like peptidoglycan-associated protein